MNDSHPFGREPEPSELRLFSDTVDTPRMRLRRPQLADASAVFHGYATDPDVTRFLLWHPHESMDETLLLLARFDHAWREHIGHRAWVIEEKATGELLGMLGLDYLGHMVEIGYVLRKSHWHRGLMPEALTAVSDHALGIPDEPLIERLQAVCHVENAASARVLEKAGFVREGLLRRHTVFPAFGPRAQDVYQYARIR